MRKRLASWWEVAELWGSFSGVFVGRKMQTEKEKEKETMIKNTLQIWGSLVLGRSHAGKHSAIHEGIQSFIGSSDRSWLFTPTPSVLASGPSSRSPPSSSPPSSPSVLVVFGRVVVSSGLDK